VIEVIQNPDKVMHLKTRWGDIMCEITDKDAYDIYFEAPEDRELDPDTFISNNVIFLSLGSLAKSKGAIVSIINMIVSRADNQPDNSSKGVQRQIIAALIMSSQLKYEENPADLMSDLAIATEN
jgi:hypothetical protein